jgi:hypothetical protein
MDNYVLCHLLNVNDQIGPSLVVVLAKFILFYMGSL